MTDYDAQPSKPFVHSGSPRPVAARPIIVSEPSLPDPEHIEAAVVGMAGAREMLAKSKAATRKAT